MENEENLKPVNYLTKVEYLTVQTNKLKAVTDQINLLTSPPNQQSILNTVQNVQSILSHLASFNKIQTYLPNIEHLIVASPIIEYSRQATLAISGLSIPSVINKLAETIATKDKPWYEENIAKSNVLSTLANSKINIQDTFKNLSTIIGSISLSALTLQSSIVKATEFSLLAEKSLFLVTLDNIGSKLNLGIAAKNYLTSTIIGFSDSYSSLLKSFKNKPISYTLLNPSILKIAPSEYFTMTNLLETISVEEENTREEEILIDEIQFENEILLSNYLPRIDSGLYKLWKGAIEAYNSNNSDKVRHFSTSIRELYTHFFHKLAPDDEIKKWTSDPTFFHEGKPTRKARLLYICRNINNSPFSTYVKKDVDATIEFIDIFQKGTHDIDPLFSPNHLVAIKCKAENTLKFLLEIHFKTNK